MIEWRIESHMISTSGVRRCNFCTKLDPDGISEIRIPGNFVLKHDNLAFENLFELALHLTELFEIIRRQFDRNPLGL